MVVSMAEAWCKSLLVGSWIATVGKSIVHAVLFFVDFQVISINIMLSFSAAGFPNSIGTNYSVSTI